MEQSTGWYRKLEVANDAEETQEQVVVEAKHPERAWQKTDRASFVLAIELYGSRLPLEDRLITSPMSLILSLFFST